MSEEIEKLDGQNESGAKPEGEETPPLDETNDDDLGDPGKKALSAERRARRAAEQRATSLETKVNELTRKLQKIEDDKAAEQGEWKKLADERASRIEELENDIAIRDLNDKKMKAIEKYKFSEEEIALVHGETLEEYEASAKALAKLLSKNSGPDVSGGNSGGGNPGGTPSKNESSSKLKDWKFK